MDRKTFRNKVVIITGASSGIGKTTAIRFAQCGASILIAARREETLKEVAQEIQAIGANVMVNPTDITDQHYAEALVTKNYFAVPQVDIFIGAYIQKQIVELTKVE